MMPKSTRAMLGIAVLAVLALPAHAQSRSNKPAAQKKLYCWDQNGQRVCSDTLPADAVNQARDEINANSGMRSAEIDRALTAEERAVAAANAAQQQADLAAEQTRKRTEQALLLTFENEDDLRRVFNERTALIDNNVQTARYNVTSLRDGLITLLRDAGDRELSGRKVPDKLANDIQERHRTLIWQQRLQASFERQRAELDGEIEQILERYRAMKTPNPG
ncbi:MAG TPA: hypothetical protein VD865_06925 [Stenotrophomonas sp.]|nr:hypothetical protein [Stenotrophomonas sp.]